MSRATWVSGRPRRTALRLDVERVARCRHAAARRESLARGDRAEAGRSAAVEGALHGIPAIALSLVAWADDRRYYETAAVVARRICRSVLMRQLPPGMILNVNVPNLARSEVRGTVFTRLGKRKYGEVLFEKLDPRGKKYYWISGEERSFQDMPGSDCNAILARKVSVTPLRIDLTDHALLAEMTSWKI